MTRYKSTLHQESTTRDERLRKFAEAYYEVKNEGFYAVAVRDELMIRLGVSRTTYYDYLRASREAGYITDTYPENLAIAAERQTVERVRSVEDKPVNDTQSSEDDSAIVQVGADSATAESETPIARVEMTLPTTSPSDVQLDVPKIQKKGFLSRVKSFLGFR